MNNRKSPSIIHKGNAPVILDQPGLERLIFFSDGVFAIAITLLALEIRLPPSTDIYTDVELSAKLAGMWHSYLAYIISFMVIGTFWMAHHRKFRFINRYDGNLMLLNLIFLMVIAFIPFTSSVISDYSGRTATIFYALTMLMASLSLTGIWWYASHHNRLSDPNLDTIRRRRQFISPLIMSGIFILSIGIAFINADLAKLSWLLLVPNALVARKST